MAKKKKLYAIRKGHKVGIFDQDWEIVKTYIQGYSKAEFKGFHTRVEAEHYMKGIVYHQSPSMDSTHQPSFALQIKPDQSHKKLKENQLKKQDTYRHHSDEKQTVRSNSNLPKIELVIQGAQDTRPESLLKEG